VHDIWQVLVLGVVEGITEFLPISSTGHLLIAEQWLGKRSEMFNVVIQAGAVLAVVVIYWRRLLDLFLEWSAPANRDYLLKLIVAFGITAVLGIAAKKAGLKLPDNVGPVAWALLAGAMVIFWAEYHLRHGIAVEGISWTVAIAVGLAQVVAAVFPGSSRSGCTIMIAMLLGVSRAAGTEFSFLVGIPTMFAASAFEFLKQAKEPGAFSGGAMTDLAIGFFVSAVVAFVAVKWLLHYIRSHSFIPFAWYRLVLGLGLLVWIYRPAGTG
jgi:undecaprenyl-diphosphatase